MIKFARLVKTTSDKGKRSCFSEKYTKSLAILISLSSIPLWSSYVQAENIPSSEQNAVILGDLNFGKNIDANTCSLSSTCESLALEENWDWLIDHTEDTAVAAGTQPYDRIVINFTDSIQQTCARANVDPFITKAVSDHYPVEFYLKFN